MCSQLYPTKRKKMAKVDSEDEEDEEQRVSIGILKIKYLMIKEINLVLR